jgi:Flp pilus assembly protein TadB
MITFLNERGINLLFITAILLFAMVTVLLHWYNYSWLLIGILLIPGLAVGLIYTRAKKNFSDYLYYFILDGIMMLSALLMLVFRI